MKVYPKISVIIPCYNTECYVDTCITSVTEQTYPNLEIIVINDGSTDSTPDIVKKQVASHSNMVYIDSVNKGVSSARNLGIECATGSYVLFLDSDDKINKNMIMNMYQLLTRYQADIVKCNMKTNRVLENKIINTKPIYTKVKYIEKKAYANSIYKKILSTETMNSAAAAIFSRGIIENNKLRFREDIHNGEDAIFFMEYIQNTNSFLYTPTPYYEYRIHKKGLTGSGIAMDRFFKSKLLFIDEIKQKEKAWKLENKHYVDKKIIYIMMSCIYKLYKHDTSIAQQFKYDFFLYMIQQTDFITIIKQVSYHRLTFTPDRLAVLDSIKQDKLKEAEALIQKWS